MSRTYRKTPTKLKKWYGGVEKVKDNSRTKVAGSCENNGGCPYCEGNRLHKHNKQLSLKEALNLGEKLT